MAIFTDSLDGFGYFDNSGTMESKNAIEALAALAQETRLAAFRLLVAAGYDGLAAGEIARRLGVPAATLSFHLAHLSRAGLITATREGRRILYRIDAGGVGGLISYLTDECCGGRPELCLPAPDTGARRKTVTRA